MVAQDMNSGLQQRSDDGTAEFHPQIGSSGNSNAVAAAQKHIQRQQQQQLHDKNPNLEAEVAVDQAAAEATCESFEGSFLAQRSSSSSSSSSSCCTSNALLPTTSLQQQQLLLPAPALAADEGIIGTSPTTTAADDTGSSGSSSDGSGDVPQLAKELCISTDALVRLFRAEATAEYDQPVWMVVNLQGKIKGSYTADKMLEFCKRGTLSAEQLVLGIDKNLPYTARQELSFYRTLGQLLVAVHHGATYTPLSDEICTKINQQQISATDWSPLITRSNRSTRSDDQITRSDGLAGDLASLNLGQTVADGSSSGGSSSAAAAAKLRSALQRLCGVGSQGVRGGAGGKQPLWLYINHLGWCRGPFSGGKVMHAHLCGRLPRNTLVAAYDPEVPACMISGDVKQWFRPLGALLDNVAAGWTYNPIKWDDLVHQSKANVPHWQPLVYLGAGPPPPLQASDALLPPANIAGSGSSRQPQPAAAAPVGVDVMLGSNMAAAAAGSTAAGSMMYLQQQQQQMRNAAGYDLASNRAQLLLMHQQQQQQQQRIAQQQQQQQRMLAAAMPRAAVSSPWEPVSMFGSGGSSSVMSGSSMYSHTAPAAAYTAALGVPVAAAADHFNMAYTLNGGSPNGYTLASNQHLDGTPYAGAAAAAAAAGTASMGWQQQQQNELLYKMLLQQQQQQQQSGSSSLGTCDASGSMAFSPTSAAAAASWQQQPYSGSSGSSISLGSYLPSHSLPCGLPMQISNQFASPINKISNSFNSDTHLLSNTLGNTCYNASDSFSGSILAPAGGSPQIQQLAAAGSSTLMLLQQQQQQMLGGAARTNSGGFYNL